MRSHGTFTDWLEQRNIPTLVDPMPSFDQRAPWRWLHHAWRVWRFARNVDLIHCNEHDVFPFLLAFRRVLRLPAVCHVRFKIDRGFASWAFGGYRCPDALLWTSHQQRQDCASAVLGIVPESKQHVVPLGVDLNRLGRRDSQRARMRELLGLGDREILIGTASPLRPRKRVEDFIEIAKLLAPKYRNATFVIAGGEIKGDERYRELIERRIVEARLGNQLRWLGFLEPVEPFYHASDIQVGTSEYETFGNSVCEAMACGIAVAAYEGGSVAEIIGDSGLTAKTGDLHGLAASVERLIQDAALRSTLGRKARTRVGGAFNPATSLEQLSRIYSSLLQPGTSVGQTSDR